MRRRDFLAALGLLPFVPFECARRQRRALVLATADTESHVAVLDAASGHVRARVATVEGPRSIEAAGGSRAVVAHTEVGAISLLEGPPTRVRRVLRGVSEPRYTAVAPGGRIAYVTDSARGEVAVIDLELGRLAGGAEVGALARHLTIAPDGRTLWVALGKTADAVAIVDVSEPLRPRTRRLLRPPFLAHDVACSPGGRRLWISSGDREQLAIYAPGRLRADRRPARGCPAAARELRRRTGLRGERRRRVPEGAAGGRREDARDEPAWPEAPTTSSTARVAW